MCYQYVYVGVTVGVVVPCVIGHTPVMYLTVTMVKGGMLVYHTALRIYYNPNSYHCQVLICQKQKTCKIQIFGNITLTLAALACVHNAGKIRVKLQTLAIAGVHGINKMHG